MELCTLVRLPVIFDLHGDIVAETNPQINNYSHLASTKEAKKEQRLLKKAKLLICNSHNLVKVLTERHNSLPRTIVLPCATNVTKFQQEIGARSSVRRKLNIENKTVVCYLGGLSQWQCISQTIELVLLLKKHIKDIHFLLITQDDVRLIKNQLEYIGEEGKDYTVLSLSGEEVPRILPAADIGILLREDSPINYAASPTKCGEYLASGVPVLTTKYAGDATSIIIQTMAGHVLENERTDDADLEKMLYFLQDVRTNRDAWATVSVKAACEHYDWVKYEQSLKEAYFNLYSH